MSKDSFDKLIKDKLVDFSAHQGDNDVWSRFESAHPDFNTPNSRQDVDDDTFDDIIRHNLKHITSSYKADHWTILKSRLALTQERNRHTFFSKLTEIAAIFCLVFTFSNWSGWLDQPNLKVADPDLYAASSTGVGSMPQINEMDDYLTAVNSKQIVKNDPIVKTSKSKNLNASLINKPNRSTAPATQAADLSKIENQLSVVNQVNDSEQHLIDDVSNFLLQLQKEETKAICSTSQQQGLRNVNKVTSIPALSPTNLESEFARIFPMQMSSPSPKPSYALSIYGAGDINLINTPFDKLYSKASYNKEALNNSYGINVSKKIGHVELETGLGYANRTYQPQIINEEFAERDNSYSEISLNKISYDIANIPINVKWHFIDQTSWKAYIMAGAALNIIANARYDINEVEIQGRPTLSGFLREKPRLEEKEFTNGILSGGNFKDNYFASVGFGFGIEKKLVNNTSIYVQPSYQRQVLTSDIGIGPNKDKIHTSSLQFGIKTVLN